MASCVCGEHNFYVKITPRQKSGNAVARASVAPVQLHCRIRHKGINTRRIIARGGGSGGGLITLLALRLVWFGSAGRPPKQIFLKVTARPQIRLWRKVTRNKK
jgi:hypothetical protein